ncbi:hypothetical protein B0H10DRAFT_2222425 [Mycena sp. CBHHK59/15]|nr:hypothetical protein B0H10DRAFT_2222425 [Mycena sp. CBHHK59/15]
MAPILFVLISVLSILQAMAGEGCNTIDVNGDRQVQRTRISLTAIDTVTGLDTNNMPAVLQVQLSLINAQNGTTQIAESVGKAPVPADALQRAVSGLQGAQGFLQTIFALNNVTTSAVQTAEEAIASALGSAQQVLAFGIANG